MRWSWTRPRSGPCGRWASRVWCRGCGTTRGAPAEGGAMSSWAEFEQGAAGLAAAGRRLLYQHGPGLGYLATVRGDGAPRIHPVCPHIAEGRLWVFVGHASPKRFDLRRDPRYALHAFPCPDVDDEFCVAGTALPLSDDALEARIRADLPFNSDP